MTRRKLGTVIILVALIALTAANGYYLVTNYRAYTASNSKAVASKTVTLGASAPTTIVSVKQNSIASSRTGTQNATGLYKFQEQDQSRVNDASSEGQLYLLTETAHKANFILAGNDSLKSVGASLNSGWTSGLLSQDSMWLPAKCASKPTYLIGGRYIFVDDGKQTPDSKYSSYLVFDMVSKKFRYFGGDLFTATQGDKEHILSIQNENGAVVFYIDTSDPSGPLSGSATFKHAAAYSPGFVTRRVLDLSTLAYTDYKIPYTAPPATPYYYIDAGTNFTSGSIVTLTPDGSQLDGKYYYPGTVANNVLSFNKTPVSEGSAYTPPVPDVALDQQLTATLPLFTAKFDANAANRATRFDVAVQGVENSLQYIIATQAWTPDGNIFDTPAVYDSSTHTLDPMLKTTVLPSFLQNNYVPIGVF